MAAIGKSKEINHDRRRFVETTAMGIAAAGTAGLLPSMWPRPYKTMQSSLSASIANAIFAATGKRPGRMPVDSAALKQPA